MINSHGRHDSDAKAEGSFRGRGAGLNPGNRFEPLRLHVLGDHLDQLRNGVDGGTEGQVQTQVIHDDARTVINRVDSPDIGFRWSVNPYRGCEHGCIYCYARPFHEYLGFSCGLDFETKIMAKLDAPERLRQELAHRRWKAQPISMSTVTDCYQPIESKLQITRRCLEVFAQCVQPVGIVTKNRLVLRDLDLLQELSVHRAACVAVSLTSLDSGLAAKMEPRASSPRDRLETIAKLSRANVPVMAMIAPVIPGLNDRELPKLLAAAAQAGAVSATYVLLRLPFQVKTLFLDWLARYFPDRAKHIEALVRGTRGGGLYDSMFGRRMKGQGEVAGQIGRVFDVFARRNGLTDSKAMMTSLSSAGFRRPAYDEQLVLF